MKIAKRTRYLLLILLCLIVFGIAFQKTYYIEKTSCKAKVKTTIFGMTIASKVEPTEMSEYLEELVGTIDRQEYYEPSRKTSFLESWVVGTPPGNWLWVMNLKECQSQGMPHETTVQIATKLISDDEKERESAEKQITEFLGALQ